ncbi:MAG: hypothetical protein AB7O24_33690 [Kofleriaceae bacterium]
MRWAIIAMIGAGCAIGCGGAPRSAIGPYVKNVARNGDWLAVIKCQIILEDNQLRDETCTIEQLPLGPIPIAPMSAAPIEPPAPAAAPAAVPPATAAPPRGKRSAAPR